MEVYFNELCMRDVDNISVTDLQRLNHLYKLLQQKDISCCRLSSEDFSEIIQMMQGSLGKDSDNWSNFLYAFFRVPYEDGLTEQAQTSYLQHDWYWQDTTCYGLALAVMLDSLAVSICDEKWDIPMVCIRRDGEACGARNLFGVRTFEEHSEWFEQLMPVELAVCNLKAEEKPIKLRDDHGKEILQDFSSRLVRSEYVCRIINSLPFHAYDRRFINRTFPDGIIYVVLPWTEQGLGIAVQTTGRNKRETDEIARILKEKYNHM